MMVLLTHLEKIKTTLWPHSIMTLLFYQTSFIKILWSLLLINASWWYLAFRLNFKQISHLKALLLKIEKKKYYLESYLITNLTPPRILLKSCAKYIGNLQGFSGNLDLQWKLNIVFWLFPTRLL